MKTLVLIAATGSLAALSAPAGAAEFPIPDATTMADAFQTSAITSHTVRYDADDWDDDDWDEDRWDDDSDWEDGRRYRRGRAIYDRHGRYIQPRRIGRRDRIWRGRDGRVYCRRDNGTTGLVIGAGVGALLGRTIDTRGDRTVGTLLGGALGAVLGRELDRGDLRCR
ncbi:MAG: glycine zipper 2TM domain-containing protein [Erythrobacter sp.]|uniref:glycine zipper 2TM domain-containing protein n=1 Tax=Erythrobacter sp. TaxID=1042 RepID=UPI0026131C75|nr:glycine zipper 2TM domain-containing protein [Erythrobacter sp.]MDJ0978036.1 glycine zipper 2TM domain-containing protein [Erythrobacter sp.]